MSIINKIKAQLNPFDDGATFSNPNPNRGILDMAKPMMGKARPMALQQEDDGMVRTNSGMMPLSQVVPGQAWRNPDNGYGQGLMVSSQNGQHIGPAPVYRTPNGINFNMVDDLAPVDMQVALGNGMMPMDMESIPTNFTANRTGYYQGSNPNAMRQQAPADMLRMAQEYIRQL